MNYISCQIDLVEQKIIITATLNDDCKKTIKELKSLLLDELLDYSLREIISEKTEHVRTLILSNAFSNTKLVG